MLNFRAVLTSALIGLAVIVVLHLALSLASRGGSRRFAAWNWWERLVYLGTLGSVAVLAATSFFSIYRYGSMSGWTLFFHMFGAGAFVAVLPVLALTWCEPSRFGRRDHGSESGGVHELRFFWFPKLMFWLILLGGLIVTLTMLVSMLPLFGTEGLEELLVLHRYSGLLVVVGTALHFYTVLLQRAGAVRGRIEEAPRTA